MSDERPTISCDHCDEPVSIEASRCPHCQGSLATEGKIIGYMLAMLVLVPIAAVAAYVFMAIVFPPIAADVSLVWLIPAIIVLSEVALVIMYRNRKQKVEQAKRAVGYDQ